MKKNVLYNIKSVMIGHAVADALGVPVEFKSRKALDISPVRDMQGSGSYNMPAGCWSDDTSMSIAALDSLSKGDVNWDEIMSGFYRWLEYGEYTPTGVTFDFGLSCSRAIKNYVEKNIRAEKCGLDDEYSNGNGSLMRIHPFVLFADAKDFARKELLELIYKASSLTHAHERSKMACGIYAIILSELLKAPNKDSINSALKTAEREYRDTFEFYNFNRIFDKNFKNTKRSEINSSGYVVDTLEAAIWCLLTTDNYKDCVLKAVNLGQDTDTVAAVAGGLAGALYGYDSIPTEWRETLLKRDSIEQMCENAYKAWIPG